MAEIAESGIKVRKANDALASVRRGLPLALQCDNRYALMKFGQVLKSLGIDPDTLLSGCS
jgi:hypothetical protein